MTDCLGSSSLRFPRAMGESHALLEAGEKEAWLCWSWNSCPQVTEEGSKAEALKAFKRKLEEKEAHPVQSVSGRRA